MYALGNFPRGVFYGVVMSEKFKVVPCAHILFERDGKVLLYLRKNTGYADGLYNVVAGHVEEGETIIEASIREAFEEAGVVIKPENLSVVHTQYGLSNRTNAHFFLRCTDWTGDFVNKEPEKCGELAFYGYDELPENMVPYMRHVFAAIRRGEFYSEFGWNRG